jgi:hypothetical protein
MHLGTDLDFRPLNQASALDMILTLQSVTSRSHGHFDRVNAILSGQNTRRPPKTLGI